MKNGFFSLLAAIFLLTGCCGPADRQPAKVVPPPISVDEQVRRIAEWQKSLPRIRADLVTAGARLEFPDENGNAKVQNAEGYLLLQQHPEAQAGSPQSRGDVYLAGKVFETTKVFEAGRNATDWWFAIFLDQNAVRTGDASQPVNLAALSSPNSSGIFRADLVFDLLGLSALPPAHNLEQMSGAAAPDQIRLRNGREKILLMRVDDFAGINQLLVEEFAPAEGRGTLYISREIIVDRASGRVSEVRIYNPAGVMVVRSKLEQYKPVTFGEGAARTEIVPQFPRVVTLWYPAQKTTIRLEFGNVTLPAEFRPAAFSTPRFDNLRVIRE
jgi:hypothetical protein